MKIIRIIAIAVTLAAIGAGTSISTLGISPVAFGKADRNGGHKVTKIGPPTWPIRPRTLKATKAKPVNNTWWPDNLLNPGIGDQWGPFLGGMSGLGGDECYGEDGGGGVVVIADPCWLYLPEDEQKKHKMASVTHTGSVELVVPAENAPAVARSLDSYWPGVPSMCMTNNGGGWGALILNVPCGTTGGYEDWLIRSYDGVTTNLLAAHLSETCLMSVDGSTVFQWDCQSAESGAMSWDPRQVWIRVDAGAGNSIYVNQAFGSCLTLTPDYWQPVGLRPCYTGPQNVLQ